MAALSVFHFAPILFLHFLPLAAAVNVTQILSQHPSLSSFAGLLSGTSVAVDLINRSSVTVLAVPNSILRLSDLSHCSGDTIRYQILLEYLSPADLGRIPGSGKLVSTLFQSTGRALNGLGAVNITRDAATGAVAVVSAASNATVTDFVAAAPYNVSVFAVDSLVVPCGFDLTASERSPPLGLNITKTLIDGHTFNVAAAMLTASGVVEEFEGDEGGAGITLFVPTDGAFASTAVSLQSLPADKKAAVLKFHVLHSYYPLGSLVSIVNPVQPTLATEDMGAGSFTLNISKFNGSLAISTGIVQAAVTQTVFDQKPVAIFGVSRVLLPREIFGKDPKLMQPPGGVEAATPNATMPPENSPGSYSPPPWLSSPPGFREEIRSAATVHGIEGFFILSLTLGCMALASPV